MSRRDVSDYDQLLMEKVARKNEDAFRELYDRTQKRVYFYLYRLLREKEAAEDVLVETFSEVWRSAPKFMGRSKPTTWILGIARNLAMNYLKKMRHEDDIDNYQNRLVAEDAGVDECVRRDFIQRAFLSLSAKHREMLDLVFFQDLSYPEIAEILGIPVNTVKTRVFYAKGELKKILAEMGVERDVI
jgi:RNA polymerase sigma-70 factor (ECF subfamily)